MSKNATVWRQPNGLGELANDNAGGVLLLETGGNILLETGGSILLEDSIYEPKAQTAWTAESKNATGWHDQGFGEFETGQSVTRTMEDGTTRLMEDGTERVLEDGDITPKAGTAWTESDS